MSNPLIGKTVVAVFKTTDDKALKFVTRDDDEIVVMVDGDCCSNTWIESLDAPSALLGKVRAVENLSLRDTDGEKGYEVIRYYGCKITTDRGVCVIDYRNSSNGYYGGSLSWPGESHYGGVYGQNDHNNEWRVVVP